MSFTRACTSRPLVLMGFKLLNQGEKDYLQHGVTNVSMRRSHERPTSSFEGGVQVGWRFRCPSAFVGVEIPAEPDAFPRTRECAIIGSWTFPDPRNHGKTHAWAGSHPVRPGSVTTPSRQPPIRRRRSARLHCRSSAISSSQRSSRTRTPERLGGQLVEPLTVHEPVPPRRAGPPTVNA
ncbi:MAG: hypothetical protein MZV64_25975 [Ignavibacteriales bacterium]|nr:hypothetical protein [Ignavibacteriales bacterium]